MARMVNEAIEEYVVEHHIDIDKLDLLIEEAEAEIKLIDSKIALLKKQRTDLTSKVERYRSRKLFITLSRDAVKDILQEITEHFITYCEDKEHNNISFWNTQLGGSYSSAVGAYLQIFYRKISRAKEKARQRGAILTDSAIKEALEGAASEMELKRSISKSSELIKV